MTATNLSALSTTSLITRIRQLETLYPTARGHEQDRLAALWSALRRELDSRPLDALLAAL